MTNPYQSPAEANAAQTVGVERGTKQRRKPGYVVAIWFIATLVAVVIGGILVVRLGLAGSASSLAIPGLTLIHAAAWAKIGYSRCSWRGFFALGVCAFVSPSLLIWVLWAAMMAQRHS